MRLKIGDTTWKVRLLTPKKFIELHDGEHVGAVTDLVGKTIDFREDEVLPEHVRHELFHAYFSLTLTDSATLDQLAIEEISAAIVGKYGEDLIKNSRKVLRWLRKQG